MQHVLGGKVEKAPVREYGKTETFVDKSSALFSDVSEKTYCVDEPFDYISQVAPGIQDCCSYSRLPSCCSRVHREESFMQSSSTQRFFILRKEPRCFTTLFVSGCAEHGRWMHLLRIQLRNQRRLAVARFYLPFRWC